MLLAQCESRREERRKRGSEKEREKERGKEEREEDRERICVLVVSVTGTLVPGVSLPPQAFNRVETETILGVSHPC